MAFISVPSTAELEITATLFGQNIENTLYVTKDDAWLAADLTDLANYGLGWWTSNILPSLSVDYLLRSAIATSLESDVAPSIEVPADPATVGGIGESSLPSNVCITVKFGTAFRGRSARGRNYLSGIPDVDQEGNQISLGFVTPVVEGYSEFPLGAGWGADWHHVVVSRFHDGAPRLTGITNEVITYTYTDNDIDSQRRRLTGRGT